MSYEVVVIASPAAGVGTLRRVFSGLPQHLPLPVVCLQPFVSGVGVEDIIPRASAQCGRYAAQDERIEAGCALFAPPGMTLVVTADRTILLEPCDARRGETEAADRFLASAARAYGKGVLALLLTGGGSDGFEGARAIKEAGGTLLVQSRDGMAYRDATQALTRTHLADEALDPHHIASAITRLIYGSPSPGAGENAARL